MADLAVWQRTIVDEEGNVIPGAEVEVRREEDGSLATLYADRAGETPLANPLVADMSGFVRFFAQGDAYTITAVGAGSTRTWRFAPVGRLAEMDKWLPGDDWWNEVSRDTLTVRIPTDFPTLQDAVDHYNRLPMRNMSEIVLLLEEGYEIPPGTNTVYNFPSLGGPIHTAALLCRYGDFSRFTIRSENNHVVPVTDDFSGNLIVGEWAQMPRLSCLIDMRGKGIVGYFGAFNSTGWISEECGIINAGQRGARLRNTSGLQARHAILTGAGQDGFYGAHACWAYLREADCSGAGGVGVSATAMAMLDAVNVKADDCNIGVYVNSGGDLMLRGASAKRAATIGMKVENSASNVHAVRMDLSDAGQHAFTVDGGSTVILDEAILDNPGGVPYRIFGGGNFVSLRDTSRVGWTADPSMQQGSLIGTNEGLLSRHGPVNLPVPVIIQGLYGVGSPQLSDTAEASFEEVDHAGFYGFWSNQTGPDGPGWSGIHLPYQDARAGQLVVRTDATDHIDLIAARTAEDYEAGVWHKWRQLIHTGRIVGSVSDDGDGDPNGAIFQSGGTHPEGYVLYADGTMECWTLIDMGDPTAEGDGTYGNPYRTAAVDWTFPTPVNFADHPSVILTPYANYSSSVPRAMTATFRAISLAQVTQLQVFRVSGSSQSDLSCNLSVHVKGKWK